MERLFTKNEIYVIIADENDLQEQWDTFRKMEEQSEKSMDKNELKRKRLDVYY